jgi:hypothetical protein
LKTKRLYKCVLESPATHEKSEGWTHAYSLDQALRNLRIKYPWSNYLILNIEDTVTGDVITYEDYQREKLVNKY